MTKRSARLFILAALAGSWMMAGLCWAVAAQKARSAAEKRPLVLNRPPVRIIHDPYPTFNGIGMDVEHGEVIMTDDNQASLLAYGSQFKPTNRVMEPRRRVKGLKTHLGYVCTLSISPEHKEIYTVDNDWKDNLCVYPLDARGEAAPLRELNVDHGAWGIFLDRKHDELVVTTEYVNKLSVYRRTAKEDEDPLRFIQGPNTGLADPHGVFVDNENHEIFVTNHGHWRHTKPGEGYTLFFGKKATLHGGERGPSKPLAPSTGKFLPPSITVYSRTAQGDVAPIRVLHGPKTRLNRPRNVAVDPVNDLLVVINGDPAEGVLIFNRTDGGDVAPRAIIGGPKTGLSQGLPAKVRLYPPGKKIFVTIAGRPTREGMMGGSISIWKYEDNGNVPPWAILKASAITKLTSSFGGVALNPEARELMVVDNEHPAALLVYRLPEVFR